MLDTLLFPIVPVIIVILFFIGVWRSFGYIDFEDVLMGVLVFMWGTFIAIILTLVIGMASQQEYVLSKTAPIYALESKDSVSGSFFLGAGGVSSSKKYYYISDYKDGKKIYNVPQNRVYVIESDELPSIEIYRTQFINEWLRENLVNTNQKEEYKFVIPKNSIKYDYNIDIGK